LRLYLVRHAAVAVHPERPAAEWHLSPDGRAAADALAGEDCWAPLARLYSSAEPKAIATAQRIAARNALPIGVEPGLGEVGGRAWVEGDYRDVARRYLRGEPLEGWEPRDSATSRFRACVETIVSRHGAADVGAVSHGLVLTLYLAGLLGLAGDAVVETWEGIGFPDVAVVDLGSKRLERPFGV
jgi:broad specificity phosphatase PhoE